MNSILPNEHTCSSRQSFAHVMIPLFKAGRWRVDLLHVGLKPRCIIRWICKGGIEGGRKKYSGQA